HEHAGGRVGSKPCILRIADEVPDTLFRRSDHIAGFNGNGVTAPHDARSRSRHIIETIRPDVAIRRSTAAEVERVELARSKRAAWSRWPYERASPDEAKATALVLGPG